MIFKPVSPFFVWTLSALLLVSLLLAGQGVRSAYGASYTVNSLGDIIANDGSCTLREAIQEANNGADTDCPGSPSAADDTITFSVSGTITLGSTLPAIVSGQGTLTIDGGRAITISGNNNVRVMQVASGANLTLQNLTIADGKAIIGSGVLNYGRLTISNSTFSNNSATVSGGGVDNDHGILTITASTFSANSARWAGGVVNYYGTATITNSTFFGNHASADGGGVHNDHGTLTIANSTFCNNSADNVGGGAQNYMGTVTIINSTFSANSAGHLGGGVHIESGTATLKNTIIANSTGGGDCVGTLSGMNNNNLIEDSANACGLTNGTNGNIIGADPNLGALTGSPSYFPLNPGSPAIDAGDNATCANPPVNNQSQNGVTRPQDGDGDGIAICDIGSYEVSTTFALFLPLIAK